MMYNSLFYTVRREHHKLKLTKIKSDLKKNNTKTKETLL